MVVEILGLGGGVGHSCVWGGGDLVRVRRRVRIRCGEFYKSHHRYLL
jgi:hypothetical protein